MVVYTLEQLKERSETIQSQTKFTCFLNFDMINILIQLFHENGNDNSTRIVKYIEDERKVRGLNGTNTKIESKVYGEDRKNSTLHLEIIKKNKRLLHLSIHLCATTLDPQKTGIFHIRKNIYNDRSKKTKKNKKTKNHEQKSLYALISVKEIINKPNSLKFSIVDDTGIHDPEIQAEMDVIITVLNRLFDEDNAEFYIGNQNKFVFIHNKTNSVLENMNKHTKLATRKNRGFRLFPLSTNEPTFTIESRKLDKKKIKRTTRKIQK